MTEAAKTITLMIVGVLVLGVAVVASYRPAPEPVQEGVGTLLFPDFTDPTVAKSLEISTGSDGPNSVKRFKVAQQHGNTWSLPSHSDYPAEAKDQVAAVANTFIGLKILDKVSDTAADHELYGVIEPKVDKTTPGQAGVGKLVAVRDAAGKDLAQLIIGKKAPSNAAANPHIDPKTLSENHYVRRTGQDQVYLAALNANKLSTRFQDWIEPDLLKLSPWEISNVDFQDYVVDLKMSPDGRLALDSYNRKSDIQVGFNSANNDWKLDKFTLYQNNKPTPGKMADNEELNTAKLNDMRNALGDLKIINVARKPAGMSGSLKADKSFLKDPEAGKSLIARGFYPVALGDGPLDILASDGEVVVGMKDGVEYLLRFGRVGPPVPKEELANTNNGAEKSDVPMLSRYILVTARFNDKLLAKPVQIPVPGAPAAGAKPAPAAPGTQPAPAAPKGAAGNKSSDNHRATPFRLAAFQVAAEKPAPAAAAAATPGAKPGAAAAPGDLSPADQKAAQEAAKEATRLAIEKKNKEAMDQYNDQVKKGKARVHELNARFADWYYIVSDDVYKKIHLNRNDIIVTKSTPDKSRPGSPNPFPQPPGLPQ